MVQNKIILKGKEIDFVKELGISHLSPEKQLEIIKKMADILDKRIVLRIMDELSEDEVMEINATLISDGREEAFKIIDDKVSDFDKIVYEEISKFKEEMLK
jgi:hypothetical protein